MKSSENIFFFVVHYYSRQITSFKLLYLYFLFRKQKTKKSKLRCKRILSGHRFSGGNVQLNNNNFFGPVTYEKF